MFQHETRGSSRGQGSIKLGPRTRRGGIPTSIFGRVRVVILVAETLLLPLLGNFRGEKGCPGPSTILAI